MEKAFLPEDAVKGALQAIWQLDQELEGGFASTGFQN